MNTLLAALTVALFAGPTVTAAEAAHRATTLTAPTTDATTPRAANARAVAQREAAAERKARATRAADAKADAKAKRAAHAKRAAKAEAKAKAKAKRKTHANRLTHAKRAAEVERPAPDSSIVEVRRALGRELQSSHPDHQLLEALYARMLVLDPRMAVHARHSIDLAIAKAHFAPPSPPEATPTPGRRPPRSPARTRG